MQRLWRAWAAGAILSGAPSTVHTLATGGSLLASTRAAGTLLGKPSVLRGVVAHAGISLWWTWVMQRIGVRSPATGAVVGAAIAGLDLGLVGRRYPAIRGLPPVPQITDHLAFGLVVGFMLGRRPLPQLTPVRFMPSSSDKSG